MNKKDGQATHYEELPDSDLQASGLRDSAQYPAKPCSFLLLRFKLLSRHNTHFRPSNSFDAVYPRLERSLPPFNQPQGLSELRSVERLPPKFSYLREGSGSGPAVLTGVRGLEPARGPLGASRECKNLTRNHPFLSARQELITIKTPSELTGCLSFQRLGL